MVSWHYLDAEGKEHTWQVCENSPSLVGEEEVCYAANSSAGLPSALSSLMPTAVASCSPGNATAGCPNVPPWPGGY